MAQPNVWAHSSSHRLFERTTSPNPPHPMLLTLPASSAAPAMESKGSTSDPPSTTSSSLPVTGTVLLLSVSDSRRLPPHEHCQPAKHHDWRARLAPLNPLVWTTPTPTVCLGPRLVPRTPHISGPSSESAIVTGTSLSLSMTLLRTLLLLPLNMSC